MWPDGYPDFPMAQHLQDAPGRVTVSCLVSDLMYVWRLREAGSGTDIAVTSAPRARGAPAPGQDS